MKSSFPHDLRDFMLLTIWMWREYGIEINKVPEHIIVRDTRDKQAQQ